MPSAILQSALAADRCLIDEHLEVLLRQQIGQAESAVPEAMRYGVLGPAQRIRPIISMRVARLFDTPLELVLPLALSVELLHCASLMIDDLPCMDDSCLRRNQASAHVEFGEATAVLAAFGLVAMAARTVVDRNCQQQQTRLLQFQIQLLRTLDCTSLIGGQALDLQLTRDSELSRRFDISELKTVPLFSLAVEAGSVFAEVDANERALLNCFGREFGLAFQMTDDLLDGQAEDRELLNEKLSTLRAVIAPFGQSACDLEETINYLDGRVSGRRRE